MAARSRKGVGVRGGGGGAVGRFKGVIPDVGSSRSNTDGLMIISCPTETLLRSPPLIPRLKKPPAASNPLLRLCSPTQDVSKAVAAQLDKYHNDASVPQHTKTGAKYK